MAITRTPGILMYEDGKRMIDKEHRGTRLCRRLGRITQKEAEQILDLEIERLDIELNRKAHARPLFRHCAARYLGESKNKRSAEAIWSRNRSMTKHFSPSSIPASAEAPVRPR